MGLMIFQQQYRGALRLPRANQVPDQLRRSEQVFDNMPDLSFPIFRPKFQQDTDTAGSADDGDDASRESGVAGNAEHDDHAGSGGE